MKHRITFKKEPRVTGLAGIGAGTLVHIKLNGGCIGAMRTGGAFNKNADVWVISISIVTEETKSGFKWVTFKHKPDTEEEVREFCVRTITAEWVANHPVHVINFGE